MPLNRTPPDSFSLPTSAYATPMESAPLTDDSTSEQPVEAALSAASSLNNLNKIPKLRKQKSKPLKTLGRPPVQKRGSSDITGGLDDLSKSDLVDMLAAMEKRQQEREDKMFANLQTALLGSISNVQTSVDILSTKYEDACNRIKTLEAENKQDKQAIYELKTQVEQLQRSIRGCSLEFRNVPASSNETKEDLKKIILNSAEFLRMPLQSFDIKDVRRTNSRSENKPIIVDFTTVSARDSILRSYKTFNKEHQHDRFCTSHLKMDGPARPVYIAENLTQKERKIHYLAREFAKNHSFAYCWTSSGRVYLRKEDGSPPIRIADEIDLQKLRPQ